MQTTNRVLGVMTSNLLAAGLAPLGLCLALACSSNGGGNADNSPSQGPCSGDEPIAGCGVSCDSGAPSCLIGLYCSTESKTCTADCSEDSHCASGKKCQTATGACVEPLSGEPDPNANTCASFNFQGAVATPNVKLLIDRSGSMDDPFPTLCTDVDAPTAGCLNGCGNSNDCPSGFYCEKLTDDNGKKCHVDCDAGHPCVTGYSCTANGQCRADANNSNSRRATRWNVLNDSLVKPSSGIIDAMDDRVRFGSAFYTGETANAGMCLDLSGEVPVAINNYSAISAAYPAGPTNGTPTGDAITSVVTSFKQEADFNKGPGILVVATDGLPAYCGNPTGGSTEGKNQAVSAAQAAYAAGVPVYMLFIGEDSAPVVQHVQEMANVGVGKAQAAAGAEAAPYWIATNPATLMTALSEIVTTNALSCKIDLQGSVDTGFPCSGTVKLNGRELQCHGAGDSDTSQGWKLLDASHLELLGTDCQELKGTTSDTLKLDIVFPCVQKIG